MSDIVPGARTRRWSPIVGTLAVVAGLAACAMPGPAPAPVASCPPAPAPAASVAAPAIGDAGVVDEAAVKAALAAQAAAWDRAIVARDRAAIEAPMAEDFRQIDAHGNVETRASFVEGLMDPALRILPYGVEEFEVRLLGRDVALLSGRTRMTGSYAGKPFETQYRYIDVYVRRDGAWKIVSVQISPLGR